MTATSWRPPQHIKVKALGLHWRNGKLLAAEVADDEGRLTGVRPLGGSMEFGERWQDALKREFIEELEVEVEVPGPPLVMENIYRHHGAVGHEVLFIAEVVFDAARFAHLDNIRFRENSGSVCTARWWDVAALDMPGGPALFPAGLKQALLSAADGSAPRAQRRSP